MSNYILKYDVCMCMYMYVKLNYNIFNTKKKSFLILKKECFLILKITNLIIGFNIGFNIIKFI